MSSLLGMYSFVHVIIEFEINLFRESQMFWSDVTTDTIHRANLDGSEEEILVDSCIATVGMLYSHAFSIQNINNLLFYAFRRYCSGLGFIQALLGRFHLG